MRLTCGPDTAFVDKVTRDDAFLLSFTIIFYQILPSQSPAIKPQFNVMD